MKNVLKWIVALMLVFVTGMVQAGEVYRVRSGDTLGGIAKKHDLELAGFWRANCDVVRSMHHIQPGWKLQLDVKTPQEKSCGMKNVEPRRPIKSVVPSKQSVSGPIAVKQLNVAPYRLSRTSSLDRTVLQSQGWTDAEVAEFHSLEKSGQCELQAFEAGAPMKWMVGSRGKVTTGPSGLVAAWERFHSARVCELASGKRLAIFQICENLAELPRLPKAMPPAVPPAAAPQPEEPVSKSAPSAPPAPPQREEPAPTSSVPDTKPAPKAEELCELDPKLVFGNENEPSRHGNDAHSLYLSAGLYCTWRGEEGAHGLGAMLLASGWNGHVDQGKGRFHGSFVQVSPSYEYISDNSRDVQVGAPMFGKLRERSEEGDYASKRDFRMLGVTAAANFYERKLEGKEWFYETQVSGTLAFPVGHSVSHTWQGRSILDTTELAKLDYYANLTVREYITRMKTNNVLGEIELYGQLGALFEIPGSRTGNARIGLTGFERCVGVGAGVDFNFITHTTVPAWGWWVDGVKCTDLIRTEHRKAQIETEAKGMGVEIDPKTKALRVTDPAKFYGEPASKQ